MFSAIRRRLHLTPSTVIASLALVFAMSGGAFAAGHFLITSTKQISPKVLKALKGANGANGAQGAAGATGSAGPAGPQGPAGQTGREGPPGKNGENGKNGTTGFTETLPSGKSLVGEWSLAAVAKEPALATDSVSFGIPLETAPVVRFVRANHKEIIETGTSAFEEVTPTTCLGSPAAPTAPPGFLCVYAEDEEGLAPSLGSEHALPKVCSFGKQNIFACLTGSGVSEADRFGFSLVAGAVGEAPAIGTGSWAVTAE